MLSHSTSLPVDLKPDFATQACLIHDDLFDDQTQELFALRRGGGRSMPESRKIFTEGQDGLPILGRDDHLVLPPVQLVGLLDLLQVAQLLLPLSLQGPRH